jgi:hypothetical protein
MTACSWEVGQALMLVNSREGKGHCGQGVQAAVAEVKCCGSGMHCK